MRQGQTATAWGQRERHTHTGIHKGRGRASITGALPRATALRGSPREYCTLAATFRGDGDSRVLYPAAHVPRAAAAASASAPTPRVVDAVWGRSDTCARRVRVDACEGAADGDTRLACLYSPARACVPALAVSILFVGINVHGLVSKRVSLRSFAPRLSAQAAHAAHRPQALRCIARGSRGMRRKHAAPAVEG